MIPECYIIMSIIFVPCYIIMTFRTFIMAARIQCIMLFDVFKSICVFPFCSLPLLRSHVLLLYMYQMYAVRLENKWNTLNIRHWSPVQTGKSKFVNPWINNTQEPQNSDFFIRRGVRCPIIIFILCPSDEECNVLFNGILTLKL